MRWAIVFGLMCVLITAAARGADIGAELAFPSPREEMEGEGGGRAWELIRIRVDRAVAGVGEGGGPVSVWVQDARGGPSVGRRLIAASEEAGSREVLLPLPLVAPAELTSDGWPVIVTIRRRPAAWREGAGEGELVEREQVLARQEVTITLSPGEAQFRVAAAAEEQGGAGALGSGVVQKSLSAAPLRRVSMSDEEIVNGPPLIFSCVDAVVVSPRLLPRLTELRATALLNAGVRLIVTTGGGASATTKGAEGGRGTPPAGALSRLVWDPLGEGSDEQGGKEGAGWSCPPTPLPRVAALEPGMLRLPELHRSTAMPGSIRWVLLMVAPAGLVLLLLARGLFRKSLAVLCAAAVALAGLTAGGIALLMRLDRPEVRTVSWKITSGSDRAVGGLTISEEVAVLRTRFGRSVDVPATAGNAMGAGREGGGEREILLPLAGSVREYFSIGPTWLLLGDEGFLHAQLGARQECGWKVRRVAIGPLIPPFPATEQDRRRFAESTGIDLADAAKADNRGAVWIEGGYVHPGNAPQDKGVVFSRWAQGYPALRPAAEAWYQMRFDARHRYLVWPSADPALMQLIDFGPPAAP